MFASPSSSSLLARRGRGMHLQIQLPIDVLNDEDLTEEVLTDQFVDDLFSQATAELKQQQQQQQQKPSQCDVESAGVFTGSDDHEEETHLTLPVYQAAPRLDTMSSAPSSTDNSPMMPRKKKFVAALQRAISSLAPSASCSAANSPSSSPATVRAMCSPAPCAVAGDGTDSCRSSAPSPCSSDPLRSLRTRFRRTHHHSKSLDRKPTRNLHATVLVGWEDADSLSSTLDEVEQQQQQQQQKQQQTLEAEQQQPQPLTRLPRRPRRAGKRPYASDGDSALESCESSSDEELDMDDRNFGFDHFEYALQKQQQISPTSTCFSHDTVSLQLDTSFASLLSTADDSDSFNRGRPDSSFSPSTEPYSASPSPPIDPAAYLSVLSTSAV